MHQSKLLHHLLLGCLLLNSTELSAEAKVKANSSLLRPNPASTALVDVDTFCQENEIIRIATDHGVVGDGISDETLAMRRLLAEPCQTDTAAFSKDCPCHRHIVIPPGATVATLPLNLTSHTTLQVDGTLLAIPATSQWPVIPPSPIYGDSEDRNGGWLVNQYQSFLYAQDSTNIKIMGSGVIDGSGPFWWDLFHNNTLQAGRPNLFQTNNCTDLELTGVTFQDAGFWTLHPQLSRNIHIHHIRIRAKMYAPNVDGIDPDACQNVMIEYNDVACGDDHIAIKSGVCGPPGSGYYNLCLDPDYQARQPTYLTRNITVRHNTFRTGMGIAIGSESSGSIEDIYVYNNSIGVCDAGHDDVYRSCGWGPALHIKTTVTRSGSIRNIVFDNNTIYNTSMFLFVETNYQTSNHDLPANYPITNLSEIYFQNNRGLGGAMGAAFHCDAHDPCHHVTVVNNTIVKAAAGNVNPWSCQYIDSFVVADNVPDGLEECMAQSMNPKLNGDSRQEEA